MHEKYKIWIEEYITSFEDAYGQCDGVTKAMAAAFPELARVRGHYYCHAWGERTHWWLIGADGAIVDPTARQFPSGGRGPYVPWNDGDVEPTGKCPNCGEWAYNHQYFCSDRCGSSYVAYCSG